MRARRGNKSPKWKISERRDEIAKKIEAGVVEPTVTAVAADLGISHATAWRDLTTIMDSVRELPETLEAIRRYQKKAQAELEQLKKIALADPSFTPRDKLAALLQIHDRLVDLLGLANPELNSQTLAGSAGEPISFEIIAAEIPPQVESPEMQKYLPSPQLALPEKSEEPELSLEELRRLAYDE